MNMGAAPGATTALSRLPSTLRLGPAHLVVTDLARSIGFYERSIGLRLHWRDDERAGLGGGLEDVLVLVEEPGARPAGRHAGLYHVALLHPSRAELGRAAARLALTRAPIYGASDHGVSEAIYLPDPDGNEIELAADRPRQDWPDLASIVGGPRPLDLPGLLASVAGEEPSPHAAEELRVGHVHLHVGDVERGLAFYSGVLGFELQMRMPTAAFTSAGGYHHHVAFNTWRGEGVPAAPEHTLGLRHWTVVLDGPEQVATVVLDARSAGYEGEEREDGVLLRDPWNIAVLLTTAPYPKPRSLAFVDTTAASEHILALGENLRRELEVSFDTRAATIRFPAGRAELHAEPGRLVLEAIADEVRGLPGLEESIAAHLQRVAAPDELTIGWQRPD